MQGTQLRSPAGISARACSGREAGTASLCGSADAFPVDVRSSAPCPQLAQAQMGAPASAAAAALVQCLAQRSAQAAEGAAAAAAEVPAAPTDVIISVSFTVAILALTIVTVGVRTLAPSAALPSSHGALTCRIAFPS